jgi:putative ABC transport system substrate-binding protein
MGQSISSIMIRAALERHRLPHIVPWRQYVVGGGLMSYGPDFVDIFRRSADYVDRILRARTLPSFPCKPLRKHLVKNC